MNSHESIANLFKESGHKRSSQQTMAQREKRKRMIFSPSLRQKLIFVLMITLFYSGCNDTGTNNPPCPPYLIVPTSPYNSPVWHPNGSIIGFNHTLLKEIQYPYGEHCQGIQIWEHDSTGFWLINVDGSNLRRALPFQLQNPSWSPDGQWIAFVSSDQIHKMRFDGNSFDRATITQLTFQGRNYYPAWSPDGNIIAYDSNNESPSGNYIIWKMKNDGSEKVEISEHNLGAIRSPNWSPKGEHIVHDRYFSPNKEIAIMDSNGKKVKRLTVSGDYNYSPKYISSGDEIVFLSNQNKPPSNLFRIDTVGNDISQLTYEGAKGPFDISPSSNNIVYTRYNAENWGYINGTIWVLDILSGKRTQLTFNKPPDN